MEIKYVYDALIIGLKARGDCGKDCLNCGFSRTNCPGCITHACLVAKCKRGISYTGITQPKERCRFRRYCTSSHDVIPNDPIIEAMPKLKVRTKVELPRFVPVIRLTDESSWFWDDLTLPWIVVRLAELVKNESLMQKVFSRGLHDFLGFDGKILLSTVMEDELLDKLTPKDYIGMINDIRPDATMTPSTTSCRPWGGSGRWGTVRGGHRWRIGSGWASPSIRMGSRVLILRQQLKSKRRLRFYSEGRR